VCVCMCMCACACVCMSVCVCVCLSLSLSLSLSRSLSVSLMYTCMYPFLDSGDIFLVIHVFRMCGTSLVYACVMCQLECDTSCWHHHCHPHVSLSCCHHMTCTLLASQRRHNCLLASQRRESTGHVMPTWQRDMWMTIVMPTWRIAGGYMTYRVRYNCHPHVHDMILSCVYNVLWGGYD